LKGSSFLNFREKKEREAKEEEIVESLRVISGKV
jgi:hypothetical protein